MLGWITRCSMFGELSIFQILNLEFYIESYQNIVLFLFFLMISNFLDKGKFNSTQKTQRLLVLINMQNKEK